MSALAKITIVAPADQETRLVEAMLESDLRIGGFTTLKADGHGHSFDQASFAECVAGRTARVMVIAVLSSDKARAIVANLKEALHTVPFTWWIEPVLEFGSTQ